MYNSFLWIKHLHIKTWLMRGSPGGPKDPLGRLYHVYFENVGYFEASAPPWGRGPTPCAPALNGPGIYIYIYIYILYYIIIYYIVLYYI